MACKQVRRILAKAVVPLYAVQSLAERGNNRLDNAMHFMIEQCVRHNHHHHGMELAISTWEEASY